MWLNRSGRVSEIVVLSQEFDRLVSETCPALRSIGSIQRPTWNAIPDMANGFVRGLHFTTAKVDLRRPAPIEDEDLSNDEKPTPAMPIDPVAIAVDLLSARMEKLRTTVKWVGGILVAVLVLMLMK